MNTIILIGRLTADPELRYTQNAVAVTSFTLAVDREVKRANGDKETDFIPVVAWQKTAELAAQYLSKGKQCAVEGRLQTRSYEKTEGQKVRVTEVVANRVQFLSPSAQDAKPPNQATKPSEKTYGSDPFLDDEPSIDLSDDDLPF